MNSVTGKTFASFEPTLDYVVAKFPRWPFDKFTTAQKTLGTRMMATGEVMSIGANFESAFMKAICSLELDFDSLEFKDAAKYSDKEIRDLLHWKSDERIFVVTEALRRGVTPDYIYDITKIDRWYLYKLQKLVETEEELKKYGESLLNKEYLRSLKERGISDGAIARWCGIDETKVRDMRKEWGIIPTYKMVDTCGAEFDALSPYYYSTYQDENEAKTGKNKAVVVLGSGPIRIGQGVEFDYCSVHSVWALKDLGYDTVIINNNPETVSTDFDTSDRLYFEPLTPEYVWNVLEQEKPVGVVVQFGGQTAIKLAKYVQQAGYNILGTSLDDINAAEDREQFENLLEKLDVQRPKGTTVFTADEALAAANNLGYPVLVRPSYVLGGQGMEIAYSDDDIIEYMAIINRYGKTEHPILVDKYLTGKELEVDAICDGEDILIPGIMEHIERAGVHSGDSISVYPASTISGIMEQKIIDTTYKLCKALNVLGMINIQYIEYKNDLYVIEVNPRSSRTVPYISKVTGVPMIELATKCMMGESLKSLGYGSGLFPKRDIYAVKVPVFSFEKLPELEVSLGPEMKSTGEALGIDKKFDLAVYKGLIAAGMNIPKSGNVLLSVSDSFKQEAIPLAEDLVGLGYDLYGTLGTAHALNTGYVPASAIGHYYDESPNLQDMIKSEKIQLIVNTPTKGRDAQRNGFRVRRMAVEYKIPCITSVDTLGALVNALKLNLEQKDISPLALNEIYTDK